MGLDDQERPFPFFAARGAGSRRYSHPARSCLFADVNRPTAGFNISLLAEGPGYRVDFGVRPGLGARAAPEDWI